jgi:hypothetical protein
MEVGMKRRLTGYVSLALLVAGCGAGGAGRIPVSTPATNARQGVSQAIATAAPTGAAGLDGALLFPSPESEAGFGAAQAALPGRMLTLYVQEWDTEVRVEPGQNRLALQKDGKDLRLDVTYKPGEGGDPAEAAPRPSSTPAAQADPNTLNLTARDDSGEWETALALNPGTNKIALREGDKELLLEAAYTPAQAPAAANAVPTASPSPPVGLTPLPAQSSISELLTPSPPAPLATPTAPVIAGGDFLTPTPTLDPLATPTPDPYLPSPTATPEGDDDDDGATPTSTPDPSSYFASPTATLEGGDPYASPTVTPESYFASPTPTYEGDYEDNDNDGDDDEDDGDEGEPTPTWTPDPLYASPTATPDYYAPSPTPTADADGDYDGDNDEGENDGDDDSDDDGDEPTATPTYYYDDPYASPTPTATYDDGQGGQEERDDGDDDEDYLDADAPAEYTRTLYVDSGGRGGVNLRTEPTTDSQVVIAMPDGERVRATEETVVDEDGDTWHRVWYKGRDGYAKGSLLAEENPMEVGPTPTPVGGRGRG